MRFDTTTRRVYVRQSWLNDLVICPERARLGIEYPQMRSSSDATIMGTAVHTGIELLLQGGSEEDMRRGAHEHFADLATKPFNITSIDPEQYTELIDSMLTAYIADVLPSVQLGGQTEHRFSVPLGMVVKWGYDEWEVYVEGTMDYVQPNGTVWDWKTANRKYSIKDKQSQSVQATVYAHAVVASGLAQYPASFRYGIMIRAVKPQAQIVDLVRNESHASWLRHTVEPAVQLALSVGMDKGWVTNDTSALCSEKWCSFWSICKGAHLSPVDLSVSPSNFGK